MAKALYVVVLAFGIVAVAFLYGCESGGGAQSGQGGDVTGPTVTVNCQVTTSGGGTAGDVIVNTNCPKDSFNPVTTPAGEGSEQ